MAKKVILIDDIDGTEADVTVEFSFEGHDYTIDLNHKNHEQMISSLSMYVADATPVAPQPAGRGAQAFRPKTKGVNNPDQNRAVREWAARKGINVPARGRIREDVRERFEQEAGRTAAR